MIYFSTKEQLKILTNLFDDYKKIEEINPDYSENLGILGMMLYMIPGAFGGNKKDAETKLQKAITTATCDYEKVNALVMYSQVLFEEKQTSKAHEYITQALEISKNNKTILQIKEVNDAGYSIFQMEKYVEKNKKK